MLFVSNITYVTNLLCTCKNSSGNGFKDFGRFLTAILIVTGVCE